MAPGSSVWPASFAAAHPRLFRGETPDIETIPHNSRARSKSKEAVDFDIEYDALLERRTKLRQEGNLESANAIQAGVNVGVLLGWSKKDVLEAVGTVERWKEIGYRKADAVGDNVVGEEMVLSFASWPKVLKDFDLDSGFGTLMELRQNFGPFDSEEEKLVDAKRITSPLLLIKIQASLHVAFRHFWDEIATTPDRNASSGHYVDGMVQSSSFDFNSFQHKAVHLLRVPNKQCGEEILYLLRNSKIGRKRFPPAHNSGKIIIACPGIERSLQEDEKKRILRDIVRDLQDGRNMVQVLLNAVGITLGKSLQLMGTRSDAIEANAEMDEFMKLKDEGLLVLEYMYRKMVGWPLLSGDGTRPEDTEDHQSGNEGED